LRVAAGLDRERLRRVAETGPEGDGALPIDVVWDAGPLVERLAVAFERDLGVRREDVPEGDAARERHAAVVTLLELAEAMTRTEPATDVPAFLADIERRAAAEAGGAAAGVELLTYHRAKGLEWAAVFLPALEEGTLPIRQATEPDELAEERRLLYVGITRARTHLWLSWARRRTGATGRESRRARSRFLDGLVPTTVRHLPPAGVGAGARSGSGSSSRSARAATADPAERSPLSDALRAWRTARAREDQVAPFIVFHDSTIEAIAERQPRSMAELRRVPGIGPTKLERYGEEIIGVVVREA
jgi:DNA helicase-2/ATP-dependent DNA helicase PcrA